MHALRRALPLALLSALAAFAVHSSLACPVFVPPQPLRSLYKFSDRVAVVRVGQSLPVKIEGDYSEFRTALHVTQNLKGEGDAVAHFYHWKPTQAAGEDGDMVMLPRTIGGRPEPSFKEGDTLLIFLDRRKEGDGYEVNDAGYGVKKLSDDDLKVYVKRIEELTAITRSAPEDKGAIAEWLVRCAEERATRWEGAYELMLSAEAAARAKEVAEKKKAEEEKKKKKGEAGAEDEEDASEASSGEDEEPEAGESAEAAEAEQSGEESGEESGVTASAAPTQAPPAENAEAEAQARAQLAVPFRNRYTQPDPSLVARLDGGQKRRLSDALFSIESVDEDDEALLSLVKDFGDARMPAFLVSQMRRVEDAPHYAVEGWLGVLADAVGDEELVKLVDDYRENATYGEEYYEEQNAEAEAESEAAAAEASEDEAEEEEAVDIEAERAKQAEYEKRAEEKRSERLKKLLAHAEVVLASGYLANK